MYLASPPASHLALCVYPLPPTAGSPTLGRRRAARFFCKNGARAHGSRRNWGILHPSPFSEVVVIIKSVALFNPEGFRIRTRGAKILYIYILIYIILD